MGLGTCDVMFACAGSPEKWAAGGGARSMVVGRPVPAELREGDSVRSGDVLPRFKLKLPKVGPKVAGEPQRTAAPGQPHTYRFCELSEFSGTE